MRIKLISNGKPDGTRVIDQDTNTDITSMVTSCTFELNPEGSFLILVLKEFDVEAENINDIMTDVSYYDSDDLDLWGDDSNEF